MPSDIEIYLQRLGINDGETAVVSLAVLEGDREGIIVAGSVIVGPPELAEQSWPEWYHANQNQPMPIIDILATTSLPSSSWVQFDHQVGEWRFLRFVVEPERLPALLASVMADGALEIPGSGESLRIAADQPSSLMRILSQETSSASRLIAATGRPIVGWVHPLRANLGPEIGEGETLALPQEWEVDGIPLPGGALFLAGFSSGEFYRPDGRVGPPLRPGLVVGRMEHRAWLAGMRGGPELQTFDVDIRSDPSQIAIWDLELDIEERDGDDLLLARRLRLGDVALPSFNESAVTVSLPTLGEKLSRRVRLFDRSGVLLDGSDVFGIVEQFTFNVKGGEGAEFTISTGGNGILSVASRLERLDRVEVEYGDLLRSGLAGRIVVPGAQGRARLEELLHAAHGELLIFDPYFGGKPNDWDVVRNLAIPIRLITGRDGARPAAGTRLKTSDLQIRQWQGEKSKPEFHDRAYMWDGGGLIVGTSPSGLGGRLALIDHISPVAVVELRRHFETWWADPRYQSI